MSTIIYHNHHIIPKYRCKEMGIHPDFEGNVIRLTRKEHADAHYQRWLKHKDKRDLTAAQILARGEIDGLDGSGKNHPMYGKKHTPEAREKMSITAKERVAPNPMQGKNHSEETKKKMRELKLGKKHTEEHRKNISEAQKGKKHSEETKRKMSVWQKGVPKTEEHKAKIAVTHTGMTVSEETKNKMSEAQKRRWAK